MGNNSELNTRSSGQNAEKCVDLGDIWELESVGLDNGEIKLSGSHEWNQRIPLPLRAL